MFCRSVGVASLLACVISTANLRAQPDFANSKTADPAQIKSLPTGVILVPGAIPSTSDSRTPVPERGTIEKNVYRNRYFGLTYPFPEEWRQEFDGPPPSESGAYVLAELAPSKGAKGAKASILVTAQDLFFGLTSAKTAAEQISDLYAHLPAYYKAEREPAEIAIANHKFTRFDYASPVAGLHWYVLATEFRCHSVQFIFTSLDTRALDNLVEQLRNVEVTPDAPRCIANYALGDNVTFRVDPVLTDRKFNPIPVRLTIGKTGKVQHVHVLSAFADQAQIVIDALLQWRFKPYVVDGQPVEIETGILFGSPVTRRRDPAASAVRMTAQ